MTKLLVFLLLFLALSAWAIATNIGSSPDEDYVLTSIWCGTEGNPPYCRKDPDRANAMILPIMAAEPQLCYLPGNGVESAACQRAIFDQEISTGFLNRGLYPSQYFDLLRNFVSNDIELSVIKMRLFNSFLFAFLIFLILILSQKSMLDPILTWLAVAVPFAVFTITSINTSSWAVISASSLSLTAILAINSYQDTKSFVRFLPLVFFLILLGYSSRFETKYSLFLIVATAIMAKFETKRYKPTKYIVRLIPIGIFLTLLTFYIQKKQVLDLLGLFKEVNSERLRNASHLFVNNVVELPYFFAGFFGGWGLGSFDIYLSDTVIYFSMISFTCLMAFSFKHSHRRVKLVLTLITLIFSVTILMVHLFVGKPVGTVIQPRYFLPFFLGIVIIAAANKTERYPNSLVITVAILASISNSIALRDTIRRYTTGKDIFISKSLNNPIEWWWQFGPQPETVWLTGTLAFAALWALLIYDRNKNEADTPNSPTPELTN
jgi:hypothetical protein